MAETAPTYTDDEMNLDKRYASDTPAPAPATSETPAAAPAGDNASIEDLLKVDKGLSADLITAQRQKLGAEDKILGQTISRAEEDRAHMKTMLAREGAALDDVKPWDAKVERQKYRSDPIADFGSFASVFAIAASAFTKQPMVNALNASAAAMNAIRDRNDQEYQLAYNAWKDNSELAIKRGNMMHTQYMDAANLLSTDMSLGDAKLKEVAARFGDQQALLMMEHGMYPQLWEMMATRAKAVEGMTKAVAASNEYTFRRSVFEHDPRRNSANPQEQMQAFNESMGIITPVDQFVTQKWWAEHPGASIEDFTEFWGQFQRTKYLGRGTDRQAFINQKVDELSKDPQTANLPTSEKMKLAENEWTEVSAKKTNAAADRDARDAIKRDVKAAHPGWSDGEVEKETIKQLAEAKKSGLTGNKQDQLRSHITQYRESIGTIDKEIATLRRYIGAAGAPGMALRLKERVGNLMGSNQTDRVQFERDLNYLQLTATRLLLDAGGRPLSAEHAQVAKIVAGLNLGDTTANTVRALTDLKARYDRLMKDNEQRLEQGVAPPGTGPAAPAPAAAEGSDDAPWLKDPKVH